MKDSENNRFVEIIFGIVFIFWSTLLYPFEITFSEINRYKLSDAQQPIINASDSIIVDLNNSTLTATFIDIPVYLKSDDAISSFDFALKFNLSKLTYSASIDLITNDPSISSFGYYNSNDFYLRYTSSTLLSFPSSGNIYITKIRFTLQQPCTAISVSDFSSMMALLNGNQCAIRMTAINFGKFIPVANFINDPICINSNVLFSNTSTISIGSISSFEWSFSNGTFSSSQNEVRTFTASGAASATLVVTSSAGCKDTIVKTQTIGVLPIPGFTYTYNCIADSVYFTNTSAIATGSIASSVWYFGDNTPISYSTNAAHKFIQSGHFSVKLTSVSDLSCSSSSTFIISLRPTDLDRDGLTDIDDFLLFVPFIGTLCD